MQWICRAWQVPHDAASRGRATVVFQVAGMAEFVADDLSLRASVSAASTASEPAALPVSRPDAMLLVAERPSTDFLTWHTQ